MLCTLAIVTHYRLGVVSLYLCWLRAPNLFTRSRAWRISLKPAAIEIEKCSRTFVKTTVAEPACRMEYNKFNAAAPHPAYTVPRPSSSAHNISLRVNMASRRGVSKRPASSEGKRSLSTVPDPSEPFGRGWGRHQGKNSMLTNGRRLYIYQRSNAGRRPQRR